MMTNYDYIIKKFEDIHSAKKMFDKLDRQILSTQDKLIQKKIALIFLIN